MRKSLKVLAGILLVVFLLLGGSGFYLSRNLPAIIEGVVKKEAPKITGTEVTLGDVQIIYGTGRVVVKNLIIKNPEGFGSPHAFWLHKLVFQLSIPSVLEDVLVIDEFSIEHANIIAEQVGDSLRTNLQVIADHAKSTTRGNKKPAVSSSDPPQRVIIKELRFVGNSIDLVSQQWGDRTIIIPDLILRDIGSKEGGLTPDQLSQHIIKLVTHQATEAVKDELKRLAKERVKDAVSGKIKDTLSDFWRKE